ncbi:MAG: bifunctional phosphoglucose/phosphomannose isomerase [Candidatus Bathyarchaeia archaeon]|jgi:glucose/mannose-6-phosphate isomerase|nr:bifunctional phosphoglucose/phosphomannose isomerase [Candidatus Bathyarchaeota archaeon A05DMB-4]MDH7595861.1 bifunctional phosphoglucose/phosphomannose isomerase [Candidatus Bathyarchaeota archaeon]
MKRIDVLDDPQTLRKIDKNNMLELCLKTGEFCKEAITLARRFKLPKTVQVSENLQIKYGKPRNIVIAGMGGSAIGGDLLRDWLLDRLSVPVEVCRDYYLPAYADEETLVLVVSYSGETEEALCALLDAVKRKCMTVAVASGGTLISFAKKLHLPYFEARSGFQPRVAVPYLFFPLAIILEKLGLVSGLEKEMQETIHVLKKLAAENSPEVPQEKNLAKKLAWQLRSTIPVVYSFRQYHSVACRFKSELNENSKIPAKYENFPELNHNDVVGWEASERLTKKFTVILIRDPEEPPEIRNRIEATKKLVLNKAAKVLEVQSVGDSQLARMFSVVFLGDLTSVYLAIMLGVDPSPVKIITAMKNEMKRKFDIVERLKKELNTLTG